MLSDALTKFASKAIFLAEITAIMVEDCLLTVSESVHDEESRRALVHGCTVSIATRDTDWYTYAYVLSPIQFSGFGYLPRFFVHV